MPTDYVRYMILIGNLKMKSRGTDCFLIDIMSVNSYVVYCTLFEKNPVL